VSGFKDLPRPGGPPVTQGGGEHPLIGHVPAEYRRDVARVIAAGKPYSEMSDEEKQAEAKRLVTAEDAELARGEQLGLS
jgi:hypothetical protein